MFITTSRTHTHAHMHTLVHIHRVSFRWGQGEAESCKSVDLLSISHSLAASLDPQYAATAVRRLQHG